MFIDNTRKPGKTPISIKVKNEFSTLVYKVFLNDNLTIPVVSTATLFATFNVLTAKVIRGFKAQPKASDYISFLNMVNCKSPQGKTPLITADNYAAHTTPEVREYLESMPGQSVEHWFGKITTKRIWRGS